MKQISLRYLMICITLIAACLSLANWPQFTFHDGDASAGVPYSHMINLRPIGYYAAGSFFMHATCSVIGLTGFSRLSFAVLIPSFSVLGWHVWLVTKIEHQQTHHPISVTLIELFVFNLVAFTLFFGIASGIIAGLQRFMPTRSKDAG